MEMIYDIGLESRNTKSLQKNNFFFYFSESDFLGQDSQKRLFGTVLTNQTNRVLAVSYFQKLQNH